MSSLPLGNTTDIAGFSPADFVDAEETRPLEIQMDVTGTGSLVPYSTLVSNALQRTTLEIRDKSQSQAPLTANWKRRFRDFMNTKNEDLVAFLKKPLGSSSPLSRAETFVAKFGRSDFQASHPSLTSVLLDASGVSHAAILEREMQTLGPSTPKQIVEQVRWLYDIYRESGEECLKQENELKLRLDIMDKTYQKIIGFSELPVNEDSERIAASIEVYVGRLMEDNRIEEQYKKTIEAYRRFAAAREMVQFFRFTDLQDKEPLCSICLTESVGFALVPCGHTLCATCLRRQVSTCYMCRTSVRDKVKLYFG